jgi:hypothetical protein|tara:strand:+ start:861 stop:1085 length:225 start_codon:yes stop_codon:yes gene_type:complete
MKETVRTASVLEIYNEAIKNLTKEKKKPKPKKTSAPKTEEVDIEKELEKLKGLLDKGLITQEQYDAKSNELLGL